MDASINRSKSNDHLKKVSIWRGENEIFTDLNLAFQPGQRVGILGRNGAGKSTLFVLLTGEIGADQGDFSIPSSWRLAHLRQDTLPDNTTALNWALDGDTELRSLEADIIAISDALKGL